MSGRDRRAGHVPKSPDIPVGHVLDQGESFWRQRRYLVDHALYWLWRVDICLMKAVNDIRVAQPPRETNADSSAGNCCLAPFVGNEIVEISIEMHDAQVDAQAGDRT